MALNSDHEHLLFRSISNLYSSHRFKVVKLNGRHGQVQRLLPVHNSAPFNSLVLYRPFQFVYTFENQHDSVHY